MHLVTLGRSEYRTTMQRQTLFFSSENNCDRKIYNWAFFQANKSEIGIILSMLPLSRAHTRRSKSQLEVGSIAKATSQ